MVYDIEFIRDVDSKAEAIAQEVIRLVGGKVESVIERAEALYRQPNRVPRPVGFRVRDSDGAVVHEFNELETA